MTKNVITKEEAAAILSRIRTLSSGPTLRYTPHAEQQMYERSVTYSEVEHVLRKTGQINLDPKRTRYDPAYKTMSYAVEGKAQDGQRQLRVATALSQDRRTPNSEVVVITVVV